MTTWRLKDTCHRDAPGYDWLLTDGHENYWMVRRVEASGVTLVTRDDGWIDIVGDMTLSADHVATFRGPCANQR